MTKKFTLLIILFIVIYINTQAQDKRFILKFAPLTALEPNYNTFEFALEYRLKEKIALQVQTGYGNRNFHLWNIDENVTSSFPALNKFETWRFRSELRYFLSNQFGDETYIAFDVMYKYSDINELDWFGENCVNGTCTHFILKDQNTNKQVIAYHAKFGSQLDLSERFVFDVYVGLGYRHIWVNSVLRESQIQEETFFDFIDKRSPGRLNILSLTAGIKFGFRL